MDSLHSITQGQFSDTSTSTPTGMARSGAKYDASRIASDTKLPVPPQPSEKGINWKKFFGRVLGVLTTVAGAGLIAGGVALGFAFSWTGVGAAEGVLMALSGAALLGGGITGTVTGDPRDIATGMLAIGQMILLALTLGRYHPTFHFHHH